MQKLTFWTQSAILVRILGTARRAVKPRDPCSKCRKSHRPTFARTLGHARWTYVLELATKRGSNVSLIFVLSKARGQVHNPLGDLEPVIAVVIWTESHLQDSPANGDLEKTFRSGFLQRTSNSDRLRDQRQKSRQ